MGCVCLFACTDNGQIRNDEMCNNVVEAVTDVQTYSLESSQRCTKKLSLSQIEDGFPSCVFAAAG